jgi:hypothetical protein
VVHWTAQPEICARIISVVCIENYRLDGTI